MTTLTIERVDPNVREWKSPDGKLDLRYITVHFADGTKASVSTKPETVDKRMGQMRDLIGKPGEFVIEGDKVKDYPGKGPAFTPGGGGKWLPKSLEERAEIMTMNALTAWATINAMMGGPAGIDTVRRAMRELHATATALVQNVGAGGARPGVQPHQANDRPLVSGGPTAPGAEGEAAPRPAATTHEHTWTPLLTRPGYELCDGCRVARKAP